MNSIKPILIRLLTLFQTIFLYRFRSVGRNVRLGRSLYISRLRVTVGNDVYIGAGCYLDGDITIGNDVMLANNVAIVGGDHIFRQVGLPTFAAPREHWKPTIISDNTWLGHGSIIINGVTIGRGAMVGAGSVVTKDVPPYAIVVGVPARVHSFRFTESQQREHEQILGLALTDSAGLPSAHRRERIL